MPRRPSFVAAPRWPVWTPQRAAVAIAIGVPAILQLGDRLVQAMSTTSVLLGADPSRPDYLRAAAGVAGGGLTLALAVVALAVVRGRPGFLAAAVGVLAAFCVLPWMAYTATAGIVTASLPPLGAAIRPDGWGGAWLTWTFWLCAAAAAAAVTDLAIRAGLALRTAAAGD